MNNYIECVYANRRVGKFKLDSNNPYLFTFDKSVVAFRIIYDNSVSSLVYLGKRVSLKDVIKQVENPYYKMMLPIMKERHLTSLCLSNVGLVTMTNDGITYEEYIIQILRDRIANKYRISNLVKKAYFIIDPSKLGEWINLVNVYQNDIKMFMIMELALLIIDAVNNGKSLNDLLESTPLSYTKYQKDLSSLVNYFSVKEKSLDKVIVC